GPKEIQLPLDLGQRLGPRLPAKRDDDVAELTAERAAAGELDRHRLVEVQLKKVVPRDRTFSQLDRSGFAVNGFWSPLLEISAEPRPHVLGLAGDDSVGNARVFPRAQGRIGAANNYMAPAGPEPIANLPLPRILDGHPADADDVG